VTNRVQVLRSSTTTNVPTAGTRQPGEVWTNFPDMQLGVIDTTKTAQKLLAVRFFSTTGTYVAGDVVVQAGVIYTALGAVAPGAFNPAQWQKNAAISDIPAPYVLPTASTTVLGGVKVDGTTVLINAGVISAGGAIFMGATPPVSPLVGGLWFDTVGGQLYIYYNDGNTSQWVVVVNQNTAGIYLPLTGGTLTGPLTVNQATSHIDNAIIGAVQPAPGTFLNLQANSLDGASIGNTTPGTGKFTTLQASGLLTPNGGIAGVTDGSNAAAGQVGEFLNNTNSGNPSSGAWTNYLSLSLTAGDWDVWILQSASWSGGSGQTAFCGISTTTTSAGIVAGGSNGVGFTSNIMGQYYNSAGPCRVSLSAPAIIYGLYYFQFTGTCSLTGNLNARRRR
jgi:hypothetical protein